MDQGDTDTDRLISITIHQDALQVESVQEVEPQDNQMEAWIGSYSEYKWLD